MHLFFWGCGKKTCRQSPLGNESYFRGEIVCCWGLREVKRLSGSGTTSSRGRKAVLSCCGPLKGKEWAWLLGAQAEDTQSSVLCSQIKLKRLHSSANEKRKRLSEWGRDGGDVLLSRNWNSPPTSLSHTHTHTHSHAFKHCHTQKRLPVVLNLTFLLERGLWSGMSERGPVTGAEPCESGSVWLRREGLARGLIRSPTQCPLCPLSTAVTRLFRFGG